MRIVKRYSNRKLYDSDAGRYVTLEKIAEMIRLGEEVQVLDHKTREDLTSSTLAQIVFEKEKRLGDIIPQVVLARLISGGSNSLHSVQENIRAFLDPVQYTDGEIQRRLMLLVKEGRLSDTEANNLRDLLIAPTLHEIMAVLDQEQVSPEDLVSRKELADLLCQVDLLEKELESMQKS